MCVFNTKAFKKIVKWNVDKLLIGMDNCLIDLKLSCTIQGNGYEFLKWVWVRNVTPLNFENGKPDIYMCVCVYCWLWSLVIFLIQRSCFTRVWIPILDKGMWGALPPH